MADYAIHEETLYDIADVIRKKDGSSALIDPADYAERINLMGMLEEKTVSGSVVAFSDGADDVPIKSASFGIVASGGGGTPSAPVPIVGASSVKIFQTGVNLIDTNASAWENNSIDYQTGQNTTSATKKRTIGYYPIKGYQNIVVSGVSISSGSSSLRFFWYDKDFNYLGYRNMPSVPYAVGYGKTCYFRLAIDRDIDISALQIEYAETTPTTYEAYKSKTPITVSLGQTIYGGTLASDGTLTSEYVYGSHALSEFTAGTSSGGFTQYSIYNFFGTSNIYRNDNQKCNAAPYAFSSADNLHFYISTNDRMILYLPDDFTDMSFTIEAIAELATPIVITGLDKISLSTYLGDNSIWCDSGDSEVVYRSSGTQTLIPPTLISKTITENGTYSASDEDADGYDEVTVNVPTGTTEPFKVLSINGTAGSETFTADKAGTYMFLVCTSAQGTASITSAVTPDLTFSKQSSDNRGLVGAIYTLGVGDTVTMSNTVVSWVYNTKVVVEMNISVSAVIDSSIVNDGTLSSFTPSVTGNALFISMAGGRSADNSYDRTYTNLNDFEFFGKVETGIFLRIRYGSTVPSYQLYGFDGGCALAIALSVNTPSLLMGGLGSSNSEEENTNSEQEEAENEPD